MTLLATPSREQAMDVVHRLLHDDDPEVRIVVARQLARTHGDDAALAAPLVVDPIATVRVAAFETLVAAGPSVVVPPAIDALGDLDPWVRGAAMDALAGLDLTDHIAAIRAVAEIRAGLALGDHARAASVPPDGDASILLREAWEDRARRHAVVSLSALSLVSDDGAAIRAALGNLDPAESGQLATALEAMEVAARTPLARSLVALWETAPVAPPDGGGDGWLADGLRDQDAVIRACAELVEMTREERGDRMKAERTSMSPMERVLEFRRISLFAELSPAELLQVANIAEERSFADGEVIAEEGEIGEELHIILAGAVRVVRQDGDAAVDVARRVPGEVVGEMSIISRAPRVASLIVEGDVRTITIGRREFESMMRERPDVALAVMRVLAERLGAATADPAQRRG